MRDACLATRRLLLDALKREGMAPAAKTKLGAVSAADLRALAQQLAAQPAAALRNAALLSVAAVVVATLSPPHCARFDL